MTAVAAPPATLTSRSAVGLAAAIRAGEVTAREVVEAHIAVLERIQPALRPLAAERFAAARSEADDADRRVQESGPDLPALLGVPATVKEAIAVAGMPHSAGVVARADVRAEHDATAVARIRAAGAIVLGVTNTSELTLWIESSNRVYGRTGNAHDPRRTAGGSSGGEGVAVGAGGAAFGLGTDFGGSIRLPAFFNGTFGFKPSPGLVPVTGQWPAPAGAAAGLLALGPLTRRAGDLMPLLRVLADHPAALGDPDAVDLAGLEVLLIDGASLLPVSRELLVARERAAAALALRGARVRHVRIKGMRRAAELFLATVGDGSGVTVRELLEESGTPFSFKSALRRGGPHTLPTLLTLLADEAGSRATALTRPALEAGRRLTDELGRLTGRGVILHPPFPRVAPRHGATVGRPWVLANTAVFNLARLPVVQVPLGLGRRGLPLGVQVVAAGGADHVAVAVAVELERALGGWRAPARSA